MPSSEPLALDSLKYDERGLVTAVIRDRSTGGILMVAWMNRDALEKTLDSGEVWLWSRSRKQLWNKGATSGNRQKVLAIEIDCDRDTLLVDVEPRGAACHEGTFSCFGEREGDRIDLAALYRLLLERKESQPEGSYSAKLFASGKERIVKKIGEEATEVVIAALAEGRERVVSEVADLLFHLTVLLANEGISPREVAAELAARRK
ncbi:MAG: bifunctional phosphoribosyl-AMP cyclohydrolase/phosphoribosyl-ATP diphosphatase HisIE [Thermoanaerobaculia bacterium]